MSDAPETLPRVLDVETVAEGELRHMCPNGWSLDDWRATIAALEDRAERWARYDDPGEPRGGVWVVDAFGRGAWYVPIRETAADAGGWTPAAVGDHCRAAWAHHPPAHEAPAFKPNDEEIPF